MKPKPTPGSTIHLPAAFITITLLAAAAQGATIHKANNTTALNLTTSWTGGVVPGANDISAWDSTVAAANPTVLGGDLAWKGISIVDPGGAVSIGAGNTLTLGTSGIDMSTAVQDLTISSGLTISGGQVWDVIAGRTLTLGTGTVTRNGGATVTASGSAGTIATTNIPNINGIIGSWAAVNTFGSYSYATVSGGNVVAYTAPNISTGTPAGAWGNIPSTGLGVDPTANWDIAASGTFSTSGLGRSVNTIRYTAGGAARQNSNSTAAGGVNIITLNGFMNAGGGAFTIGGDPGTAAPAATNGRLNVNIGANKELVLAPMSSDIVLNGIILNNAGGASGVTIFGNNKVILNGNSTYTGPTVISGGTLQVASPVTTFGSINTTTGITINGPNAKYLHTSSVASTRAITLTRGTLDGTGSIGAVTVGAGTGGVVTHGNGGSGTLTIGSLAFGGVATTSLKLAGGATTAVPALTVTGALSTPGLAGSVTVDLQAPTAALVNGSTYNLIGYGSFSGNLTDFTAAGIALNPRQALTLGNDTVNKFITATVTGDSPKWTGADTTEWIAGTTGANKNWKLISTSAATDFIDGDAVLFDDTATGSTTIDINAGNINTTGLTFNNSTKTYTINSGGFGIGGNGALVKSGTGTVVLNTTNTLTGATTINAGTLQLGNGTTDGSIATSSGITNNGSLVYRITGFQTYANIITGSGSLTKNDPGTLVLSGANTYSGATNVSGGTLTVNGAGTFGTGPISLAAGTNLNIDKNLTITNTVTGSGAINNTGSATVSGDFSGFTGTYTHNTTAVSTGFNAAIATSRNAAYVIASAQGSSQGMISAGPGDYTLELGSLTGVANSLFRGGNVATGTTNVQVGNLNTNDTFAGIIANGAAKVIALTKVGTGIMTLSGSNSYTGNTTVNGGTLALADNAQLKFVIGANGVNNSISGNGTVTLDGDFNLDLTAANLTPGNSWTLVNVGTLNETFGSTFTLVGFTRNGTVHTLPAGANVWTFTESTGVLTYTAASNYSTWAASNVGGALADVDTDGDGVKNGVEYFMNASAGFTANPGVVSGSITWPNGGNIPATDYGTQFVVQTSPDLVTWTPVPVGNLTTNTNSSLQYTLPTGQGKVFVRLVVSPN